MRSGTDLGCASAQQGGRSHVGPLAAVTHLLAYRPQHVGGLNLGDGATLWRSLTFLGLSSWDMSFAS